MIFSVESSDLFLGTFWFASNLRIENLDYFSLKTNHSFKPSVIVFADALTTHYCGIGFWSLPAAVPSLKGDDDGPSRPV